MKWVFWFQEYFECPGPDDPPDHTICCGQSCCPVRHIDSVLQVKLINKNNLSFYLEWFVEFFSFFFQVDIEVAMMISITIILIRNSFIYVSYLNIKRISLFWSLHSFSSYNLSRVVRKHAKYSIFCPKFRKNVNYFILMLGCQHIFLQVELKISTFTANIILQTYLAKMSNIEENFIGNLEWNWFV